MRTRDFRRHNSEKFRRHCRKLIKKTLSVSSENLANNKKFVGKLFRNRKICSCFMCGNPRKYFNEKTVKERRQEQKSSSVWNKL